MERSAIKEKIITILKTYTRKAEVWETADESSSILRDLKVNSARFVDLVLDVEDEFDLSIEDSTIDLIITIGDLIKLVEDRIAQQ